MKMLVMSSMRKSRKNFSRESDKSEAIWFWATLWENRWASLTSEFSWGKLWWGWTRENAISLLSNAPRKNNNEKMLFFFLSTDCVMKINEIHVTFVSTESIESTARCALIFHRTPPWMTRTTNAVKNKKSSRMEKNRCLKLFSFSSDEIESFLGSNSSSYDFSQFLLSKYIIIHWKSRKSSPPSFPSRALIHSTQQKHARP